MINDLLIGNGFAWNEIIVRTRQGKEIVKIDKDDSTKAAELNRLVLYKDPKGRKMARTDKKDGQVLLHRYLFDIPAGARLIWKNDDTLDLRRSNLQLEHKDGTLEELLPVEPERKTSDVKGVKWHKASSSWEVRIYHEGKRYSLGYFKEVTAAEAEANLFRNEGPDSPKLKRNQPKGENK
jgi:hypothetical protein